MHRVSTIQKEFFQLVKEKLSPNISLVFEVSSLLGISQDSAYRRIRGEKELTLEELFVLKDFFNISLDQLNGEDLSSVNFNCSVIQPQNFRVSDWLAKLYEDTKRIHDSKQRELIYAAKDPPVFHYFQLPEIAAFKVFFWEKTLFQFPEYKEKMFCFDDMENTAYVNGRKALALASQIPTIEIWNNHTFTIMLSQIEFYIVSGFFKQREDLLNLLDKMEKWIHHIQKEAELGFKFLYGSEPNGVENNFRLYYNEVVLNDNTILVRTDSGYSSYLTFNVISLLNTTNQSFCIELDKYFRGLITKSNLISHTGAKERNRFFNSQLHALEQMRSSLS